MASGVATVKEVVLGDTVVLVGCPRGGPPPEKRLSLSCVRAPRIAMKSFTHEQQDEAYGYTSREFMRRTLIGQTVEFCVDPAATAAARPPRGPGATAAEDSSSSKAVGTITLNGEDVRIALLKNGLAKLDNYAKAIAGDPKVQELERCQEEAEQKKVGVWNSDAAAAAATVRDIQWALNDAAAVKAFAAANKHKRIPAVVEYVRDGGCVRVSLYIDPQQQQQQQQVLQVQRPLKVLYTSVVLSGVQCDGFKREQQDGATGGPAKIVAEPFAAEARFFVETRLLNRDVEVRIEGSDEFGNIYGSLYHPRGNISLLLLQNGLARLHAATVGLAEAPAQMRVAMQEAQQKHLRRWKNWQSSTANIAARDFTAVVAEVISGDTVLLQLPDGSERRVYLSSVRCVRGSAPAAASGGAAGGGGGGAAAAASRGAAMLKDEDSMAFQAKEFVRKKLIGKKVEVSVDYVRELSGTAAAAAAGEGQQQQMQFVSIHLSGGGAKEQSGATRSSSSNGPAGAGAATATATATDGIERQNIAAMLLQQGLAKTVPHRADDERAQDYENYLELEKGAQQRKAGLHAPQQQWATFRIVDLTGPANVQRAQAHFQQLERMPRIDCVVEYIFNASRFKLRIPSQNMAIFFALSGVRSPQASLRRWGGAGGAAGGGGSASNGPVGARRAGSSSRSGSRGGGGGGARGREAEPFGDEALAYARSRLLQREVKIKVEAIDKGGNFLGTMWASGGPAGRAKQQQQQALLQQQQQGSNFAAELLELGLAYTVDFSLAKTPYKDLLMEAEQKAREAKVKLWSLQDSRDAEDAAEAAAAKDVDVDEHLAEVVVSHTEKMDLFYLQEATSKQLESVNQALSQYAETAAAAAVAPDAAAAAAAADDVYTPGGPPRRGELVLAQFTTDGAWYRARVEGAAGSSGGEKTGIRVTYVDFGNSEVLPLERLRRCPSCLRSIPPQAKPCCLSGLLPPPEMELEAASAFESLTQNVVFCCNVERIDTEKRRHVILTPQENSGSGKSGVTINEKLLRQGLARLDKKSKTKIFHRLQLEEEAARKAHINVWRYGDCGADDDEDSYAPLNERS